MVELFEACEVLIVRGFTDERRRSKGVSWMLSLRQGSLLYPFVFYSAATQARGTLLISAGKAHTTRYSSSVTHSHTTRTCLCYLRGWGYATAGAKK